MDKIDELIAYYERCPGIMHHDTAHVLREMRDRLEAVKEVLYLAGALSAESIESYNARKKPVGEWDDYDEMVFPLWEELAIALAACQSSPKTGE